MSNLDYKAQAAFRRLWGQAEGLTDDDTKAYFLQNPDVLRAVADGSLLPDLDKVAMIVKSPPGGPTRPQDLGGWNALDRDVVRLSLSTRTVAVDYRLDDKQLLQAAKVMTDRVGTEAELDEYATRKKAIRTCGVVVRLIKRLAFSDGISLDELRGIFRIKHEQTGAFQPVDPRTLLAYAAAYPKDLPRDVQRLAVTATCKTMRGYGDAQPILPLPYLRTTRAVAGTYLEYTYDNLQGLISSDTFGTNWIVLVDVTPPDQLP